MTCSRAQEIDLLGFLEAPRRQEFDAFRDHYPRCAVCAAEVAAWTELQLGLQAQAAMGSHPDPALLLAFADTPDGLAPPERAAVDAHLDGCDTCRDELRSLGAWSPAPSPATPGWRRVLASLVRVTWHPAFAYALVGLLLFPVLYRSLVPTFDQKPGTFEDVAVDRLARTVAPTAPGRLSAKGAAPLAEQVADPVPVSGDEFRLSGTSAPSESVADAAAAAEGDAAASNVPVMADTAAPEPRARRASEVAEESVQPPQVAPAPVLGTALAKREHKEIVESPAEGRIVAAEAEAFAATERVDLREATLVARAVAEDTVGQRADREESTLRNPAAPPSVVELDALRSVQVEPQRAAAGFTLRLPLTGVTPADASEVMVELAEAMGPRVLRERLHLDSTSAAIDVDVPPLWMVPGRYRLSARDGRGRFAFDFRVDVRSR